MRRDNELIRRLLLDLEACDKGIDGNHSVDGYRENEVLYHVAYLVKAGLAEGPAPAYSLGNTDTAIPFFAMAFRLTPEGHDFIDTLRDDTVWSKVKERTVKVGSSVSLEVLKAVGGSVAKQMLGLP